jgi:hypothetical protein
MSFSVSIADRPESVSVFPLTAVLAAMRGGLGFSEAVCGTGFAFGEYHAAQMLVTAYHISRDDANKIINLVCSWTSYNKRSPALSDFDRFIRHGIDVAF